VVGDDLHGAPTSIEQFLNAKGQSLDLRLDLTREVDIQLMASLIEVADLQPAA
jgi:hypothetical protein